MTYNSQIKDIVITEVAVEDLETAHKFYEYQNFYDFKPTIINEIKKLKHCAGMHKKYLSLFCMFSDKFPYAIYYCIKNNICIIVAILDTRQSPKNILNKLKGKNAH